METRVETKKENKVVTWIKDNKGKIIASAVFVGLTALGIHKIKHMELRSDGGKIISPIEVDVNVPVPEKLKELGVDEIISYGNCMEFMSPFASADGGYPIQVKDIDKLAEGIRALQGITDDSDIWFQVSVGKDLGNL